MMPSMTARIDELRRMSAAELVHRYHELFGKEPRCKNRAWLWRRCAWRLQEQQYGGLSVVAKRRLEELIDEIELPPAERDRTVTGTLVRREPGDPLPGTTITRKYKGRELRLQVLDDGFELEGVKYASLSAAAFAATGSRWNGRLFWGMTTRRQKK